VAYPILKQIIRQEGTHFQQVENFWRPQELLLLQQVRSLLHDMQDRYNHMAAARDELQTLVESDRYIKLLLDMRLALREANFQWKADQLRFLRASSRFYSDYGAILRLLRFEQLRGTFTQPPANEEMKGV
jgi:hypothetical protein